MEKSDRVAMSYASKLFRLTLMALCFNMCYCQRKIATDLYATINHRFMVYLVQSNVSKPKYDAWMCGGALVKTNKVLTSAACLIDSTNLYVIAGSRKYISSEELDNNECTKTMKRRVIKICVPQVYNFDPTNATIWMTLDIGVAVVDRRYRSTDILFKIICDYAPKPIPILYQKELLYDGYAAISLGWGTMRARRPDDPDDYNSEMLKQYPTYMQAGEVCHEFYGAQLYDIIEKYMICTRNGANIDDNGRVTDIENKKLSCRRRYGTSSELCDSDGTEDGTEANSTQTDALRELIFKEVEITRTGGPQGVCQNDHGAPLVGYIGGRLMVIGVTCNTLYDTAFNCMGPAIHTATTCTGRIIWCMLSNDPNIRRSYIEEGFEIIERDVEWPDEPPAHSAPAASEDAALKEAPSYSNVSVEEIGNGTTRTWLNHNESNLRLT